jgi:YidC/Oxa1 family membrane protein insertase
MFNTIIVQPIFNLLVLIYALLPGHNFGMAIILFTILVRLLMWPLVKKQLHHAKAMRQLQPELKRIKKEAKGDKQKESQMVMELYKEREINPFSSIGLLIVQIPILIALYSGIRKIVSDPSAIIHFSYPILHNLSWMKQLEANIHLFDATLFGIVDLTKPALQNGAVYWPAMIIVLASAISQYYQSKQLLPDSKDSKSLRQILRGAGDGKGTDQAEVNAAVGRTTRFFVPAMVFFFTVNLPSALSLYWLTSGIVAIIQQSRVLRQDEEELETPTTAKDLKTKEIIEAEVLPPKKPKAKKTTKKKRRK